MEVGDVDTALDNVRERVSDGVLSKEGEARWVKETDNVAERVPVFEDVRLQVGLLVKHGECVILTDSVGDFVFEEVGVADGVAE